MAKANLPAMNELHGLLAAYFKEALESGEDLSSGTLTAIISFLKNNNINVDAIEDNPEQDLGLSLRKLLREEV